MTARVLRRFAPAALWAALIFFLSSRNDAPSWLGRIEGADKVVHACVFGVLCACLLHGARWPRSRAMWWAAVCTSVYGITDEYHQGFVPGRTQDVFDWVADTTGAVVVVLAWQHFGPQLWRVITGRRV